MVSGIYQIKNQINGKRYIGSAVSIRHRWAQHLNDLCRGKHHNTHLQRAFNKYDEAIFVFEILEETKLENLIEWEQHYFDTLKPEYNISPTAGSSLGVRHSEETRAKMCIAMTGERNSNYGKTGEQHPRYGKRHSAKTRAEMSIAHMGERNHNYGKHPSEKTLAKMREAQAGERHFMYGKHHNAETLKRMRAAKLGERNPNYGKTGEQSPNYGKHLSMETRAKISVALTGKHHSEATRVKMCIAQRARRRRERELKEE